MNASNPEEFKELVMKYVEVCDQIDRMAPLRKAKTQLMKGITDYMKVNGIAQCNLRDGGCLVLKQTKSASPVNKDYIAKQLESKMPPDDASRFVEDMWSKRQVVAKDQLKRTKKDGMGEDDT
jgi:hypothetical protein